MIKIENTEVVGWKHAIMGMRNPLNSWDKSDSEKGEPDMFENCSCCTLGEFFVGKNDLDLMKKLVKAGTDHRKFMRMIVVYADVTAPLYFWKEYSTYKVGTVANSCSTMHKIHEKEFTLEDFSCEHLAKVNLELLEDIIVGLNDARDWYLKWDYLDEKVRAHFDPAITCKKDIWWQMIQLLPSSYNQKRTVMLNYEVLTNIYHSRKNHKLDEWRDFCAWIRTLPYQELITGEENE